MESLDIASESGWSSVARNPHSSANVEESSTIEDNSVNPNVSKADSQNTMLLDADDLVTPNQINAEKPIWRHPLPRTALVVVGVGAVSLSVIRLTQGNGSINPNPYRVVEQSPASVTTASVPKGDDVKAGKLQAQIATIKQQQQLDEIKKARQNNREVSNSAPPVQVSAVQPSAPVPVTTPPRPRVTPYNPPRRVYSQPIPVSRIPTQTTPVAIPRATSRVVAPPAPPLAPPTPAKDPMEQWLAAANIGSYGSTSLNTSSTADNNYQAANAQTDNEEDSSWQASGGVGTPPPETKNTPTQQDNSTFAQTDVVDEQNTNLQAVSYSSAANSLIVGTKANGKLETPIAWTGRLENPTQNFLIELNEPLKSATGSVAIPKGAYLVAKVIAASEAGLLQMSVSSMLVNENGQTTEKPVPQGALLVLGKGGRPLKASAERPDTTGNNLGTVVLRGLATTAGLVNRPSSQSIYSNDGYSSTVTNGDRNYLAGFGEGAAQALLEQAQNRNQRALYSRQSEPTVFVLNQGASVQIFVNQSVSL